MLLDVRNLKTHFFTDEGIVKAVDDVSLSVRKGKTLCVVGESGCGKSVTALSIMRLVEKPGQIIDGEMLFYPENGYPVDIAKLSEVDMRKIRGGNISLIFQEPMTSLSPVHTIGSQIEEAIMLHLPVSKKEAQAQAIKLLRRVGIPKAEFRLNSYTFELSGGMRQRAMIAMALSCRPSMLIADEPTTALDVTTQANILDLIRELQDELGMAVMFITHDLGVVAEIADEVAVMYLGQVVERGLVDAIFHDPKHPYTKALLGSIPRLDLEKKTRLASIAGAVPHPFARPLGCSFHPRCDQLVEGLCEENLPPIISLGEGREVRCSLYSRDRVVENPENRVVSR
jgi:peptide/nickel transport system ATP-binding protein